MCDSGVLELSSDSSTLEPLSAWARASTFESETIERLHQDGLFVSLAIDLVPVYVNYEAVDKLELV